MHTHRPLQASASLAPFTLQVTCVCTYKIQVCISMLTSISLTHTHAHTCMPHTHGPDHTKPHMLPHTPMAPYTLQPSLPHSLKRRELVKDARRQHADRVVEQVEAPGHETRRQSALTHSTSTCPLCPSACTCLCPMHMRHAHARVHRTSLAVYARTVHACAHVHVPLVMNTIYQCDIYT